MQRFQLVKRPASSVSVPSMSAARSMFPLANHEVNLNCGSVVFSQIKIFVIHYKKLIDRKNNILAQFEKNGITDFEFIEIDRDELHGQNTSMFEKDYSKSQIAIALCHVHAYEEISKKYEHGLIFEDDVGDGCNLHIEPRKLIANKHIYTKALHAEPYGGAGATRCTDSYLVSKKCAKQLHDYIKHLSYKIKIPIDWWLNQAATDNNFKVYWAEPTIVTQGTQNGTYKTSYA